MDLTPNITLSPYVRWRCRRPAQAILVFLIAVLIVWAGERPGLANAAEGPKIHEITMAAPDIIRVEVREGPIHRGEIVKLAAPSTIAHGEELQLPDGRYAIVIGPLGDHARTFDTADFLRLDREAVDRATEYPAISGLKVEAVYRKSVPWSSGKLRDRGATVSFQHFIYLKLSGRLPQGTHMIRWPGELMAPAVFDFDDTTTRASSIRASQLGYAPGDASKIAYLAQWLPGGPENGALDFRKYDITSFEIIDTRGAIVFSNEIRFRVGPTDVEDRDGIGEAADLITYRNMDNSTFMANRAGTYVFGLDFGGFTPSQEGDYRIRIPGLGVSDVFPLRHDAWQRAARTAMGGLYNQRSGMALDGRFGYTRPECFTEKSGVRVYQSKMPLVFSTEGGGPMKFADAAADPWITQSVLHDAWGGYQDAGDWDRRIDHVSSSYLLLDVYEQLPAHYRDANLGTPASRDVLPLPQYKEGDLPDIVDEAIWNIDFYRRLQRADGAVSGGVESADSPSKWEPCWLESLTVFAYAPDAGSTYRYAAAAAKLAIVTASLGQQSLSQIYRDSAVAAWNWSEIQMADSELGMTEAFDLAGVIGDERDARIKALRARFADYRLWAAGTLFRLTGQPEFNTAVRERFAAGWVDIGSVRADGAWEYAHAQDTKVDRFLQDDIRTRIVNVARSHMTAPQFGKTAYRNMKHGAAPMAWGEGGAPNQTEISLLIRAHRLTGAKEFLKVMLDGSAHILGANQVGKSFTIGIGQRWPVAPLHSDSIAAGVDPPAGITIYGWALQNLTNYLWIWNAEWAPMFDGDPQRRVDPYRFAMPLYEYIIEYPTLIMSSEYTVQQSIATTAATWLYLAGQADAH